MVQPIMLDNLQGKYTPIQRLVHNYIWFGKEDHATRAKVAWPILISPKSIRGLGLIDPLSQSKDNFVVWCEESNQGMTIGKCYYSYASLTLGHEKGPIGAPEWDGF